MTARRTTLPALLYLAASASLASALAQPAPIHVNIPQASAPTPGHAATEDTTEIAKKLQNPVGDLISVPFTNYTNFNVGPNTGTQNILQLQPVVPIHVNEDWNVITRTVLSAVWSPSFQPGASVPPLGLAPPASKLATARQLDAATATSSLGPLLELGTVSEQELYAALDWLLSQQPRIESRLAQRHLSQGTLVLYDVSSTYFEGHTCPLARRGYSRDGKRDKLQIIFGLLCASDGCPVAVEVFAGNTGDPATLATQITKLKQRFRLDHVVLVGDRGMITEARVETVLKPAGLDWITALRAPTIRMLARSRRVPTLAVRRTRSCRGDLDGLSR